jgi:hypothetical protein
MNNCLTYSRHGQSAACGPHAALQTFFAALECFFFYCFTNILTILIETLVHFRQDQKSFNLKFHFDDQLICSYG